MAGGRRCILVIEDDSETAEQLVDTLATNGYQVDLSIDGNDGLARGRSVDYTVMTIDRGVASIGQLPPASYDCSSASRTCCSHASMLGLDRARSTAGANDHKRP
jgi:hypothetical protein